jgi:hypothetical protein
VTITQHPDLQARLDHILQWFTSSAEPEHKQYEDGWDNQDRLYFGHKRFLQAYSSSRRATPKGRDVSLQDARKEFGAELHIPMVFSAMETIMPRALSNRPKMLWEPRDRTAEKNVENVRIVCDAQQEKAQYELKLQTTARSGLKHGLGVQKTYWRLDERNTFVLARDDQTGEWVRQPATKQAWDDPDNSDVDIRDFFWDPYGDSMATVRRVLHRSWRDTPYCLSKMAPGADGAPAAWNLCPLTPEELEGQTSVSKHQEAWSSRRNSMGLGAASPDQDIHEVWELHEQNTGEVITILDRLWVVSVIKNPYWHGEFPFQIYRPIEIEHSFVGYGVIDPIEDLQNELNWLRTDRRWNAMLKLHQSYAYNDGLVDPSQIKIGPGRLNPVNGDPHDLLVPLTVGDIPNSGYQEEAALLGDIERTTGVSDQTSGGGSAGETATGVQLVQAAAGLRIQAYTHRLELETIAPQASQWLALNQQRWTQEREIPVPKPPMPGEAQRRWSWRTIGPEELAGEFSVSPLGGSTAPDNVPQKRNDAMLMMQLGMSPAGMAIIDQQKLMELILEKLDIDSPQSFIKQPDSVPSQTLDNVKALMVQSGIDPAGAQGLIQSAVQVTQQQIEQAAQAQSRAPGGPQAGQQLPPPTQNGGGPAPAPTAG